MPDFAPFRPVLPNFYTYIRHFLSCIFALGAKSQIISIVEQSNHNSGNQASNSVRLDHGKKGEMPRQEFCAQCFDFVPAADKAPEPAPPEMAE